MKLGAATSAQDSVTISTKVHLAPALYFRSQHKVTGRGRLIPNPKKRWDVFRCAALVQSLQMVRTRTPIFIASEKTGEKVGGKDRRN